MKTTRQTALIVLNKVLGVLPFVMLIATAVSAYLSSQDIYLKIFPYLPDSIGYSLATGLMAIKIYWKRHYCFGTKVAVGGLITMNLVSLITKGTEYYNIEHDIWITAIVLIVAVVSIWFRW